MKPLVFKCLLLNLMTLGTRLLQNEVSFELIQQLLGHRDMDSMKLYLSIDEQGLKQCALPLLSHGKVGS